MMLAKPWMQSKSHIVSPDIPPKSRSTEGVVLAATKNQTYCVDQNTCKHGCDEDPLGRMRVDANLRLVSFRVDWPVCWNPAMRNIPVRRFC